MSSKMRKVLTRQCEHEATSTHTVPLQWFQESL